MRIFTFTLKANVFQSIELLSQNNYLKLFHQEDKSADLISNIIIGKVLEMPLIYKAPFDFVSCEPFLVVILEHLKVQERLVQTMDTREGVGEVIQTIKNRNITS